MTIIATPISSASLDAYVTLAEADTYFDDDPRATAFLVLSTELRTWYLNRATQIIDSLPLRGTKYDIYQDFEFPRIIDGVIVGDADFDTVVPDNVKKACMEEALEIYLQGTSGSRKTLQEQGVQSFSIGGKLSETFVVGSGQSTLLSATAKRLMRPYIGVETR
jgi:hypothetical protein